MLTEALVRMEYSPTGIFEDRATYTFINRSVLCLLLRIGHSIFYITASFFSTDRKLPVPQFAVHAQPRDGIIITTSALQITYAPVRSHSIHSESLSS